MVDRAIETCRSSLLDRSTSRSAARRLVDVGTASALIDVGASSPGTSRMVGRGASRVIGRGAAGAARGGGGTLVETFSALKSDDVADLLEEAQRGGFAYRCADELPRAQAMVRGG